MDDIVSSPPEPNLKRAAPEDPSTDKKLLNLKGNQFMMPTPPDTDQSSNVSPDTSIKNADHDNEDRAASPAPSSSALSSVIENTHDSNAQSSATTVGPSSSGPPAKRRKLTPSERLEKQHAKEAKDRERAEQKARREEQKRVQDEEKRRKAEEREAKRREKEMNEQQKKREKELKEEQKVQEKLKKERSQMRLGAFFQKPATQATPANGDEDTAIRARRRSMSLELYDDVADQIKSPAKGTPPPGSAQKPYKVVSDYRKTFLAFELQSHSKMVPLPQPASEESQDAFERELKDPSLREKFDLGMIDSYQGHAELKHYFAADELDRGMMDPDIRQLVDTISGTSQQPIDLTGEANNETAMDRLQKLSIKYLHFNEDVRPAYCGTYTKIRSPRLVRKVTRNPFTRARPDTDYDYDSEAEWEEPEEGDEEVLSEEEDEADSQADANEIDDFLDDEDDDKSKRKVITGELVPESTGLCWANTAGRISVVDSIETQGPKAMDGMRMGVLLSSFSGSTIDPFSTAYWDVSSTQAPEVLVNDKPATSSMPPPRVPLQPRLNINGVIDKSHDLVGAAAGEKGPITHVAATQGAKRGPKPAPKTLSKEDLDEFKEAVIGSPCGKLDLQKGLKERFPKMTHEVIKETLSSQFAQVGKGRADKRWVFVGES